MLYLPFFYLKYGYLFRTNYFFSPQLFIEPKHSYHELLTDEDVNIYEETP